MKLHQTNTLLHKQCNNQYSEEITCVAGEVFTNHIPDKQLIPKIHKEFRKLTIIKQLNFKIGKRSE